MERFVAVEGPIGVGKTTLTKKIAEHFQFHEIHEIVEDHPLLPQFYEDMNRWGFQTEMFFLTNRYTQLSELANQWPQSPVVADYHLFKNLLFAQRSLSETAYKKYAQIYHLLAQDVPSPNLVIYLFASVDTLMQRIKKRGRDFEQNMNRTYIEQLVADYERTITQFEQDYPHIPVIRIDGDTVDFVTNQEDLHTILSKIEQMLQKKEN